MDRKIFETGSVRITPASFYFDSSLNLAIQDDETIFSFYDENSDILYYSIRDYYVFCTTGIYDYRFYVDFDANCCLVIRDMEEFAERIRSATKENLKNIVDGVTNCPVYYVDPLRSEKPTIADEIFFSKHFRYAYQHEFRFVWRPREEAKLEAFSLEIGDITDIAEFISRDHT